MTTPQPRPKKRLKVEPEPGGRLEQLLVENKRAHDEQEAAGEREDEYKQAVKNWLTGLFPDGAGLPDAFDITADPHGRYPAYTMTLKGGKRFNAKAFRADAGDDVYERYEVGITPSWELRESERGGRH